MVNAVGTVATDTISGEVVTIDAFVPDIVYTSPVYKGQRLDQVVAYIEPIQSGSGDPSPQNIRPINGWTSVKFWSKPTYDPTQNPQLTVSIPITYAGSYNITTGVGKARPYYASYSGQPLVGPWISSMDVYTPGGTPTTGAQVVDLGGVETEYHGFGYTNLDSKLGTNKIWVNTGNVEVTYLKFTPYDDVANIIYTEQVNAETKLKPGAVCSSCIQFDLFAENGVTVSENDVLGYCQTDDNGITSLFGIFNVFTIERRRAKQVVLAYDNIIKFDVNYSYRLAQLQNAFPMTIDALTIDICNFVGVPFNYNSSPISSSLQIQHFYKDNLSCRQLLSYIAEICGCFVMCDARGKLVIKWFQENSNYRIYPTNGSSGSETYVYYQMNGLVYGKEVSAKVDIVKIERKNQDPFYYPDSITQTYARDINDDGNVILYNMNVVDNGDAVYGDIIIQSDILSTVDTSNDGNLKMFENEDAISIYVVSDNVIAINENETDINVFTFASRIYMSLDGIPTFRNTQVDLFRFFNPYRAGDIARVTDINGVSFKFPIVKHECRSDGSHLSTNNLYEE